MTEGNVPVGGTDLDQVWYAKVDERFETHNSQEDRRVNREQEYQDGWHSFALEQARNHAEIVNRMAQDHASASTLVTNNAALIAQAVSANMVAVGSGIGAQVAQEASEAATAAVNSALAQAAQTSAPAQGTTGVAQGALQAGEPIWMAESLSGLISQNRALTSEVARLAQAVTAMIAKTVGEESTSGEAA